MSMVMKNTFRAEFAPYANPAIFDSLDDKLRTASFNVSSKRGRNLIFTYSADSLLNTSFPAGNGIPAISITTDDMIPSVQELEKDVARIAEMTGAAYTDEIEMSGKQFMASLELPYRIGHNDISRIVDSYRKKGFFVGKVSTSYYS